MTGIERFCEIMDVQPDVNDAPGAKELTGVKGDVDLRPRQLPL